MPILDWNGTANNTIGKIYDWNGTTNNQIGEVYDWNGTSNNLIYKAQSDTYTITASATTENTTVTSTKITNTENYEKMVIESVSVSGGNYGGNWAKLYCNGTAVKNTGTKTTPSDYQTAVKAWSGSFNISQNGTVYVQAWTDRDESIDDATDKTSVTVKFHFE